MNTTNASFIVYECYWTLKGVYFSTLGGVKIDWYQWTFLKVFSEHPKSSFMWQDLGKSTLVKIEIFRECLNYKCAKYEHLQLYCQWATTFCNAAITIANIKGGKLARAHTQNRTFFKNVGFSKIRSHIYMHMYACYKLCFSNNNTYIQ